MVWSVIENVHTLWESPTSHRCDVRAKSAIGRYHVSQVNSAGCRESVWSQGKLPDLLFQHGTFSASAMPSSFSQKHLSTSPVSSTTRRSSRARIAPTAWSAHSLLMSGHARMCGSNTACLQSRAKCLAKSSGLSDGIWHEFMYMVYAMTTTPRQNVIYSGRPSGGRRDYITQTVRSLSRLRTEWPTTMYGKSLQSMPPPGHFPLSKELRHYCR